MEGKTWSIDVVPINGPEDLRESTRGSDIETVQLKPGKLQGSITHIGIGDLSISMGQISSGIRTRGPLHRKRIAMGTILASAGSISHWWTDVRPGDIGIFPPGVESDAINSRAAAYLVVSIDLPELLSMLDCEDRLADPAFWNTKRLCRTDPQIGTEIRPRLNGIMSILGGRASLPSMQSADFLSRAIVEAFVVSLMSAQPPQSGQSCYNGARLVREAEDYVDAAEGRPVHISELCSTLRVSRRSLHRAFEETLDMWPVAYLRLRRLSTIRSVLKRSDPATIAIADLAFEHGFPEPGRFAAYYRAHFGESPSETLRAASLGTRNMK